MAKKGKRKHQHDDDDESGATLTRDPEAEGHAEEDGHKRTAGLNGRGAQREQMSNKEYEKALKPLQVELVKLQNWAKQTGARVIVVFEGRDAAGKGGCIKAITERVSPRVFRIVALPAPTEREKIADVSAALHGTLPRGRRDRALRPQLVQPRGRRACA